ncbi:hypothetical protein [Melittangium boletus]|uniref:hypothetical protein n=1 Tax=Melittangium boletus TaxID=83453 RepID=UPI003DA6A34E
MNRYMTAVLVPMLTGCTGFPFFWRGEAKRPLESGATTTRQGDFTQATLEWKTLSFDGETLKGRLLIGSTKEALLVDTRIIEPISLALDDVVACDTGRALGYVVMDVMAPARQPEHVLKLVPGTWYGKDVSLFLFMDSPGQVLPQCFRAELVYRSIDVVNAGRINIRAEREPPVEPQGAGTP